MSSNYRRLSQSYASTRVSLRWLPEPPFENTETLVLTVGEWYVDLRVDKGSGALDWAIAGECTVKDVNPRRIVFTHTIDSHGNFNVSDPCPFIPLPNGYDLETGAMPRPDLSGNPVTEYEELWRYLSKDEIGMDAVESPTAWILESEDDCPSHHLQQGFKTFLARIEGRYLALQQTRPRATDQMSGSERKRKIVGGEVSAKSEEFVDGRWRAKYALGPNHSDLPSITCDFDALDQHSWGFPEKKVNVRGCKYVVRAFEVSGKLFYPTQPAKV